MSRRTVPSLDTELQVSGHKQEQWLKFVYLGTHKNILCFLVLYYRNIRSSIAKLWCLEDSLTPK